MHFLQFKNLLHSQDNMAYRLDLCDIWCITHEPGRSRSCIHQVPYQTFKDLSKSFMRATCWEDGGLRSYVLWVDIINYMKYHTDHETQALTATSNSAGYASHLMIRSAKLATRLMHLDANTRPLEECYRHTHGFLGDHRQVYPSNCSRLGQWLHHTC